jgi:hypothetical protein
MRIISFRDTALLKRGLWFGAAALLAAVAAPAALDGSLFAAPLVHVTPLVILALFLAWFLGRLQILALVDEVIDCGDHLQVRRGVLQDLVPLAAIASAEVLTAHRLHRVCLRLRTPTRFGSRIQFWPPASLWGNAAAVERFARDLSARAASAGVGN